MKVSAITLILYFLLINISVINAEEEGVYYKYYKVWEENRELASNYLQESERAFEQGDELSGCDALQKASAYGVKATKSLISAIDSTETKDGIENIKVGLDKWIELGEAC